jgi:hypothetical protein
VKNVSYLGNVYRSYCEPVIYVSHAGRDGSAFSRFPRGGSEVSRVLLSHDLGHYSLPDRDVSIRHVRIKQEWACRT